MKVYGHAVHGHVLHVATRDAGTVRHRAGLSRGLRRDQHDVVAAVGDLQREPEAAVGGDGELVAAVVPEARVPPLSPATLPPTVTYGLPSFPVLARAAGREREGRGEYRKAPQRAHGRVGRFA